MTVTHVIDRLGHRGDGIAAGPVFAPRCLPGETVTGEEESGRLTGVRILQPSPDRVTPPCPHYGGCGGCTLQHGRDGFVADWKAGVVEQALAAQGLEAPVEGPATSPPESRRRAVLHGRRTRKGAIVGFHGPASGTLVAVPECRVLHPHLRAFLPALEALTVLGASRKGELHLAATLSDAGIDVAVAGGKPLDGPLRAALAGWAEKAGTARLSWDGEGIAMRQAPVQTMGRARVVPPPGAFLQATAEGEAALVSAVRAALAGARRIADLFAGCGTFTLPLAEGAEVHAVESDAAMLDALDRGWRHAEGLGRVTTETRDLFRRPLLAHEFDRFDAAIVDPPRAGAEAQMAELAASGLRRLAMVSCNPVTFARDVRILGGAGWRLNNVRIVDQFRWSPHIELAAALSRPHIPSR